MHSLELFLSPYEASSDELIRRAAASRLGFSVDKINALVIRKKSIDARRKPVRIRLVVEMYTDSQPEKEVPTVYERADPDKRVIIVGCGPAGMFAALRLLESGWKPIILERGKAVKERRRDLAAINKGRIVDPDSNYCFGEGGAGTYSDGKLYTRSGKRGNIDRILKIFTEHGADSRIRYEAHPHIGTNKLPGIIEAMRETILEYGGEIHFDCRVTDLIIQDGQCIGAVDQHQNRHEGKSLILATGHSARDIFRLLHQKGIHIETKPFALGVRIEHPQELIDQIQYKCKVKDEYLPPASYALVEQAKGRGVFSFCMCPGGIIAPAATSPGEVVVNGWSPSKRNGKFANSGMVVALEEKDFQDYADKGPLAGLHFQAEIEKQAFIAGGSDLTAPAQRMVDFCKGKTSSYLPDTSYIPGVRSSNLLELLPAFIGQRLQEGLIAMGKKMKGYMSEEAVLVGVESRTSSPVRIPRDRETLEHPDIEGLYPCAEGAGYAGGIVSAAIDGERCANAIISKMSDVHNPAV